VPRARAPAALLARPDIRAAAVRRLAAIENDVDALGRVIVAEIDVELELVTLDNDQGSHAPPSRRPDIRPT
jgi:hypothetical protein